MTIVTKYSNEQECWVLYENKAQQIQITEIRVIVRKGMKDETMYFLNNLPMPYTEDDLFETKEDLLQSL